MRLIDADALKIDYGFTWDDITPTHEEMYTLIDRQPTIEERKTGKWIHAEWENINTGEIRKGRRCSACGCGYFRYDVSVNTVSDIPNFCPNCGADMRGDHHETP